jgi:hypothetical protein
MAAGQGCVAAIFKLNPDNEVAKEKLKKLIA